MDCQKGNRNAKNEISKLNTKLSLVNDQLSKLGYVRKPKYVEDKYIYFWTTREVPVSTYNKIYDDIILSIEFDKKDLASLEKELVAKYS